MPGFRTLGQFLHRQGRFDAALAANEAGAAIRRRMDAQAPGNRGIQLELAMSLSLVGDDQRELGRPGDALATYREAAGILRALADGNPGDTSVRRTLGLVSGRLAVVAAARGDLIEALGFNRDTSQTTIGQHNSVPFPMRPATGASAIPDTCPPPHEAAGEPRTIAGSNHRHG